MGLDYGTLHASFSSGNPSPPLLVYKFVFDQPTKDREHNNSIYSISHKIASNLARNYSIIDFRKPYSTSSPMPHDRIPGSSSPHTYVSHHWKKQYAHNGTT